MPFLVDLLVALAAGCATFAAAHWYSHSAAAPAHPAEEAARAVGEAARRRPALRAFVTRRVDRSEATGLLLTLALATTVVTLVLFGALAVLVRRVHAIQHVDGSVATWGYDHRGTGSTDALQALTNLGNIRIVVGLAVLLVLVDLHRRRSVWSFLFLLTVLGGMEASMLAVKDLVGRLRPTLNPAAASLGPSFPSGHSATAAAFYAAATLVLGRHLRARARHMVAAVAVATAVAVAASRVLLDLHWLSDVVGGLALGWAWFAFSAVVFGGRLLRPTAGANAVKAEAAARSQRRRAVHSR